MKYEDFQDEPITLCRATNEEFADDLAARIVLHLDARDAEKERRRYEARGRALPGQLLTVLRWTGALGITVATTLHASGKINIWHVLRLFTVE